MFSFLKDKLKSALGKFTRDVEKQAETTVVKTKEKTKAVTQVQEESKVKAPIYHEKAEEKITDSEIKSAAQPRSDSSQKIQEDSPEKHKQYSYQQEITQKNAEEHPQKHTESITIDSAKAHNEDNTTSEIEDEDFKEELTEKKGFFSKITETFGKIKHAKAPQKVEEEIAVKQKIELETEKEQSKGFFSRLTDTITKTNLTEEKFNDIFWDLEVILMENNVAVEVIDKIKLDLKKELVATQVKRGSVEEIISETLQKTVHELFDVGNFDLVSSVKAKKPFVIAFFGINGSGKTTTIAKLAYLLQKNNLTCVIAAGDTFRAAAIQQMEEHTQKLNIKLIKHEYGSDPAAVAFDAIKYAEAKKIDVVLIDTAGRMHSNTNLMDEMKKIIRVAKPDLKIFIGEAITGNDCVEQAKEFNAAVGIDAIILCKADVDEKGGAALSISYVTKKPILYLGIGQSYEDLQQFDKKVVIESLGV